MSIVPGRHAVRVRSAVLYAAVLATLLVVVLSRSAYVAARLPGSTLSLPAVVAVAVIVGCARWPIFALPFGALVPYLPLQPLATWFGTLVMAVAIVSSVRSAGRVARSGAAVMVVLLALTAGMGLLLHNVTDGGGVSIISSLVFSVALGVTAACADARGTATLVSVSLVGGLAAMAIIRTPGLLADRNLVILGSNANGVGYLCALGAVAALALIVCRSLPLVLRLGAAAVAAVCAVGVYDTGSRGALVSALAGLTAIALSRAMQRSVGHQAAIAVFLVALTVNVAPPAMAKLISLTGRQQQGAATNLESRQQALDYALHQGAKHPLTGVGIGRLAEVAHADVSTGFALSAHDTFAGIFAESGVLAMLAVVGLCGFAFIRSRFAAPVRLVGPVVAVIASGVSLQWWGDGSTGPVSLLVLGAAVGHATAHRRPIASGSEAAKP